MRKTIHHAARPTRLRGALLSCGVTALAVLAALSAPAAATTGQVPAMEMERARAGCPSGHVCIYPDATPNGNPDTYFRYGAHNLRNVFGDRLVVNNQTGGAGLRLCAAYGGQNCGARLGPGGYVVNLSPVNSILLEP
ncbi:unnamed protein product [[Actinomadura] parvosata subsp. kistnae]|uniref:Peptidase inhibitor family I36 n=1 Tax=[Actinomadura] parvosata subsp. kistnae TaxID=1909395 RepID=A0A1U9ZVW9_9ACTN|nr:hypothetical protein [Nonomuraea sp. ATCC 55076]AQZ62095.1 hypothetical protein BKM31_11980 [Nonomuraea sp. ATCC 55076]SPL89446.1 unnamed protein product [Actinomadura parvosata subsp. kistnae]